MGNIFSASNLLESNFTKPIEIDKINLQESYLVATLDYLEEMDMEIAITNKILYKSILEAGNNPVAINESFSSFCESIKNIIIKFLDFIKRIIQKFILTMNKLVKSDKYITKHKKDLDNFGPDQQFEMDMYIFTHLVDDNAPKLEPLEVWNKSQGYASSDATKDLLSRTTAVYNDLKDKLNGGWYDTFRASVINNDKGSINSEDFVDELFKLFRNNSSDKSKEDISYDKVIDAYNRFEGYDNNLKHINENKKKLEKGYNDIKKEIESWATAGTDGKSGLNIIFGDAVSTTSQEYIQSKNDIDEKVNLFIKLKTSQIDQMCKTHAMAFSAKLDAIKDCYIQDKKLIYGALTKVQKIKPQK